SEERGSAPVLPRRRTRARWGMVGCERAIRRTARGHSTCTDRVSANRVKVTTFAPPPARRAREGREVHAAERPPRAWKTGSLRIPPTYGATFIYVGPAPCVLYPRPASVIAEPAGSLGSTIVVRALLVTPASRHCARSAGGRMYQPGHRKI